MCIRDRYRGVDGYIGRCDSRQRAEGYVDENELSTYPELGLLGVGVSKQYVPVSYTHLGESFSFIW